jgi:3-oxoacyl-[acyl-carrier protein] reductase
MKEQVIVITGCASGIGRALAKRLYEAGHTLTLTDVNEEGLRKVVAADELSDSQRVMLRPLDVRDPGAWRSVVKDTVERWGRIDTLLNVAGILVPVWAHEASDGDVDRTIDINTKGLIHGTNTAIRHMVTQKHGHVVNVASIGGIVPVPGLALYSASKHAARAYSIAVAQEVRKHNVFVTAVCPALVATPMMDIQIDREEASFTFAGRRPLTVDEVTKAIVDRAMVKRPLELVIDVPGSALGLSARLGNLFPELAMRLGRRVARAGVANQRRMRG